MNKDTSNFAQLLFQKAIDFRISIDAEGDGHILDVLAEVLIDTVARSNIRPSELSDVGTVDGSCSQHGQPK